MNTLGLRPLMQTPQLPRITSQDRPVETEGGDPGRSLPRRAVEGEDRRLPTWKGESPVLSPVTRQPGRLVTEQATHRPGCPVTPAASRPAARAAAPAEAAARIVEPATVLQLRQGAVVRLAVGGFEIELVLRDSRLYGKVLAETASAKDLIEGHLDDLRRGLERRGIEIGALEVTVADAPPSGEPLVRSLRPLLLDVLA